MLLTAVGPALCAFPALAGPAGEEVWNVGTWKTAQTIQPFLYQDYTDAQVAVHPFTNPADQKSALLAGSLDMTGTTLALAIQAASRGDIDAYLSGEPLPTQARRQGYSPA